MNWKGSSCGLILILSQYMPGGIEENHEKPQPGFLVLKSQLDTSQIEARNITT
jgi:hypothetical protein